MAKESFYNFWVRKNIKVKYEYERYVMDHIHEHRAKKLKHWMVLFRLNMHYRVFKRKKHVYYPFVEASEGVAVNKSVAIAKNPVAKTAKPVPATSKKPVKSKIKVEAESLTVKRTFAHHMIKKYATYDAVVFDVFSTLIFLPLNSYEDLYYILESVFNINNFHVYRAKAEVRAREKNKLRRGNMEITLYDIYEELSLMTNIDKEEGVKTEFGILKKLCYANPYMKRAYDILCSYNHPMYVLADSILTKDMMKELLQSCGYTNLQDVMVSSEYNCNKQNGELFKILKRKLQNKTIIYVGGNYAVDVEEARKQMIEAHFYKSPSKVGATLRAGSMSSIVSSAYAAIINNNLHSGLNRFSLAYEYGFVYAGMFALGYSKYISEISKKYNVEKNLLLFGEDNIFEKTLKLIDAEMETKNVLWSPYMELVVLSNGDKATFIENILNKLNSTTTIVDSLEKLGLSKLTTYFKKYGINEFESFGKQNELIIRTLFVEKYDEIIDIYAAMDRQMCEYFKVLIGEAKTVSLVELGWSSVALNLLSQRMTNDWKICDKVYVIMAMNNDSNVIKREEIMPYVYSTKFNIDLITKFLGKGSATRKNAMKLLLSPRLQQFICISAEGKFLFAENDNKTESIVEIQNGILDFVQAYCKYYGEYEFMMDISGHDAYMPLNKVFGDIAILKVMIEEF